MSEADRKIDSSAAGAAPLPRGQEALLHLHLISALEGEVIVDIGQIGPRGKALLDQAVRAGKLAKWRGKWFPVAGSHLGIGPDKVCWSTPAVAAEFAALRAGVPS